VAAPPRGPGAAQDIIFLTADAYGVMPPIAKLDPGAGDGITTLRLTAKAPAREGLVGVEPNARLPGRRRSCRGSRENTAPCWRLHPQEPGRCWLVNSGWNSAVSDGVGRRLAIKATRALVTGALDGSLPHASVRPTDIVASRADAVPAIETHLLFCIR